MAGNLALTFLFKDQDLHEIIKFKQGGTGAGAANSTQESVNNQSETSSNSNKLERRTSKVEGQL